jgi:uncharacterized protein (DUF2236 family)
MIQPMTNPRAPIRLPAVVRRAFERQLLRLLVAPGETSAAYTADFLLPAHEAALAPSDGVSWRVFGNALSMFVGGVAAVVLELAEPRVRSGVWDHTSFRTQPLARLQRTGHAAMLTVYGPRSRTCEMIARVNRLHARIAGATPAGVPYRASDPELLAWVQATAAFGFLEAYRLCVRPLATGDADRYYAEGREAGRLYGVPAPPASAAELAALFEAMRPRLERSQIVFDFLRIVRRMPALPWPLRPLQGVLVKAAVQCLPAWTRERLGLDGSAWRLADWQWRLLRRAGGALDRLPLATHPGVLACRRLGLADDAIYRAG